MKPINQPHQVFRGKNFITPHVLGYYKLRQGYAELSEGEGMQRQPIFGVTVRPDDTQPRRSQLFQSLSAAEDYIEGLS